MIWSCFVFLVWRSTNIPRTKAIPRTSATTPKIIPMMAPVERPALWFPSKINTNNTNNTQVIQSVDIQKERKRDEKKLTSSKGADSGDSSMGLIIGITHSGINVDSVVRSRGQSSNIN